jgi:hypothetical protein
MVLVVTPASSDEDVPPRFRPNPRLHMTVVSAGSASTPVSLASAVKVHDAILDGELVCLDGDGRPMFDALIYSREQPFPGCG